MPTVEVVKPTPGARQEELVLPGTMQPLADAPIYARTNGYVRKRHVDIGTRVKAGQLLADIDTPEIDRQLDQARADLATAEANARLAQTTAERYRELMKTDSVSHQDLDNANGTLEARQAAVDAAKAGVKRLDQLHAFGRIEAPFDGVVTARNIDVGALIDSGQQCEASCSTSRPSTGCASSSTCHRTTRGRRGPGLAADLTLAEFPGRRFTGVLARTAESIDVVVAHAADRVRRRQCEGGAAGRIVRRGSPQAGHRNVDHLYPAGERRDLRIRRPSGRDNRRRRTQSRSAPMTVGRDYGNNVEVLSGLTGKRAGHRQSARLAVGRAGRARRPGREVSRSRRRRCASSLASARWSPLALHALARAPAARVYKAPPVVQAPAGFRENANWKPSQPQ